MRALNKQLGEAEADYLTGTERLAALRREVSSSRGPQEGVGGVRPCALSNEAPALAQGQRAAGSAPSHWYCYTVPDADQYACLPHGPGVLPADFCC